MDDLKKIISQTHPDLEKKGKSMLRIQKEVEKKEIIQYPSLWETVTAQISCISGLFWIGQVGFLLLLFLQNGLTEDLRAREILVLASAGGVYLALPGIAELYRNLIFGMAELEQTCYLNLQQIWAAKMLLFGVINLIGIAILTVGVSRKTSYTFYQAGIYIMVSFVVSLTVYLKMLFWEKGGWMKYAGAVFILLLAGTIPAMYPKAYETAALWIWMAVLLVSGCAAVIEVKSIFDRMEGGKMLCWNYH